MKETLETVILSKDTYRRRSEPPFIPYDTQDMMEFTSPKHMVRKISKPEPEHSVTTYEEAPVIDRQRVLIDELKEILHKRLGDKIISISDLKSSEQYGAYIEVLIDGNASEVLDLWLKVLDELKPFGIPTFFYWNGKTDIPPEKLGAYLAKALIKMNLHPSTRKPINIVKILEEEWK